MGQKITDERNFILKTSLISYVDQLSFPTVQFGLERKISGNLSVAGELGYQFYEFKRYGVDTTFVNTRGLKANVEFRRYNILKLFRRIYESSEDMTGVYLAINFFYRGSRFNNNVYYLKPGDSVNSNDCFWVKKTIWGGNLVLGIQKNIGNRFTIDIFSGLGVMYRTAHNFQREYNDKTDLLITPIDVNARAEFNRAGLAENNGWHPGFNAGIRMGIRF
ncbi:MAG TPA: hypothetical protein VI461_01815 [Chitinophagaceae bacterium]|nr:hypothetical protein [Chitinophagaceae bacterium]